MFATLLAAALVASSANSRCPVTGLPVTNHRLHHFVTVHGRPYYVHDREAANRLRQCPDCYLAKDGTPLNGASCPTAR